MDKISVLKRSVDKYSEEAKKKIENQLLRNTLNNNDSILSNFTKTLNNNNSNTNVINSTGSQSLSNRNLVDKNKDVIFKKVNTNSFKQSEKDRR